MSQDQQTYKRAAHAALLGLCVQLFLALFMAVVGIYAQSSAINVATCYFFGGLPVWLILWIVFHQHQLERVESLESEQLARSDAEAARLFDEAGQQLALARKRLDNLYKYGLNVVSLIVGLYLLIVGVWLFISHYGWINFDALPGSGGTYQTLITNAIGANASPLVAGALAAVIGFIGFIVARYVSGMTRERDWRLLRGGAGYLMGNVVIAVLVVLAALADFFGSPAGFAVLSLLIPIIMAILGAEMLLAFVLGVYRPRRAGELVRAAFDSRVLGWLSSPESIGKIVSETLNYQFGFEISRSWFYRLLSRAITPLIVIGILVLLLVSSLVIVGPQQKAVVTRFGQMVRIAQPGLSMKWPWPIGAAKTYPTGRVKQIVVGSDTAKTITDPVLWAKDHDPTEVYAVFAPPPMVGYKTGVKPSAAELGGIRVVVKYHIANLRDYVTSALEPRAMLTSLADRLVYKYLASHSIDQMLSGGRATAGPVLRRQLQASADQMKLGLRIAMVGVTEIHPPHNKDVAKAFHDEISAFQDEQTDIQKAKKTAVTILAKVAGSRSQALAINAAKQTLDEMVNRLGKMKADQAADAGKIASLQKQIKAQRVNVEKLIGDAGGQAAQILAEARGYRWSHALKAAGDAQRFSARVAAYKNAPYYYTMRMYLNALAKGLADQRKIVITKAGDQKPTIRYELQSQTTALQSVLSAAANSD